MTKVSFYLNEGDYNRVKGLTRIEDFTLGHPQLVWSWSTYFRMKQKGYDVNLTCKVPDFGIVVMPAIYPGMLQKPPNNVLFVCTIADSPPPLYMQVNVTQNPMQATQYPNLLAWPVWRHIPHWPQPYIIPRDEGRQERFETIAYFGHPSQLEPSLRNDNFLNALRNYGLNFEIRDKNFADYSDVDAVIAIRSFSDDPYFYKPYTKLVNGWIGKVPVIAGIESSFQSVKKSELDYLQVENYEQLIAAILRLKESKALRKQMIENGVRRMKEFDEEAVMQNWEDLLFVDAQNYYNEWIKKRAVEQQLFYIDLFVSRSIRSFKNKLIG